ILYIWGKSPQNFLYLISKLRLVSYQRKDFTMFVSLFASPSIRSRAISTIVMGLFIIGIALSLASCGSSTRMISSWKDPGTTTLEFKKVLVVYITKDASSKRAAEDLLVHKMARTHGVAAYSL